MDNGYGQQQRSRPDERDRHQYSTRLPRPDNRQYPQQTTRVPRPQNGYSPRPPIQLASPPRSFQQRQRAPRPPRQQHVASSDFPMPSAPPPQPYQHRPTPMEYRQHNEPVSHQSPPSAFRSPSRHLSHISALSTSQPAIDSRPVSEITAGPKTPTNLAHYGPGHGTHSPRNVTPGKKSAPTSGKSSPGRRGVPIRESETLPAKDQAATMEALTAAIRQGLGPSEKSTRSNTPKPLADTSAVRMPFSDEPESPSSIYTDATHSKRHSKPLEPYQGYDARDSKPSTIEEKEADDFEKSNYHDLPTPMSNHPILAGDNLGEGRRGKRPPRLDMDAVRDTQARGSMTSLTDLIRRATRLAGNLDRGKTASRLGHLDMFGSSDKLDRNNVRASTYSDVLASFPQPDGTSTPGNDRPTTMWPHGEKQFMASKSSLGRMADLQEGPKPTRKCCGLSPVVFVIILVVVVLLVAAAVLIPIFLILIPKQHKGVNLSDCSSSHKCQNGGISVVYGNVCSCICTGGFTSSDCSAERDPECSTSDLKDGTKMYNDATVASSVLPILTTQQSFSLNMTTVLSTFAYNNLSCASENSLVDFDTTSQRMKRFVIVPGVMEPTLPLRPTSILQARQAATQSANGIVYATTSDTPAPAVTATSSAVATGIATATTSSATPSQTRTITDQQRGFAAAVVLYVLQLNSKISGAVAANQAITSFFMDNAPSNSTVEVVMATDKSQGINANFNTFDLSFSNGTKIGNN